MSFERHSRPPERPFKSVASPQHLVQTHHALQTSRLKRHGDPIISFAVRRRTTRAARRRPTSPTTRTVTRASLNVAVGVSAQLATPVVHIPGPTDDPGLLFGCLLPDDGGCRSCCLSTPLACKLSVTHFSWAYHLQTSMVAWPYNKRMNLTARSVTRLAGLPSHHGLERSRARRVPARSAGYAQR